MKVLLGQTNPTPGDFTGNTSQIHDGILRAAEQGADMAIFPELCVPGYLHLDKIREPTFINQNLQAVQDIIEFSRSVGPTKPYILLGYADRNTTGVGKPFRNMGMVIHDGISVGRYQKWLLPYYDVFHEGRYFAPGNELLVFEVHGVKWGFLICEDWWNDKGQDDYLYGNNPVEYYRNRGVKNLVTINFSPYELGKAERRISQAKEMWRGADTFIFLNTRGGSDELVADGHSFVLQGGSLQHVVCSQETPHYEIVSLDQSSQFLTLNYDEMQGLYDALTLGTRDYVHKSGFERVLIGSSGGIDSALVAMSACDAIGPENVFTVQMPSQYSSDGSLSDSDMLHTNLGIPRGNQLRVPINTDAFAASVNEATKHLRGRFQYNAVADQNDQARERAQILMRIANAYGMLLLTTGNKTEATFGYSTIGGDMMGVISPIKDLYKGEVYQLSVRAGKGRIPESIITKKPTAELKPGQFDEDDLAPYPVLDAIAIAYCEHFITTYPQFYMWAVRQKLPPKKAWEMSEEYRSELHKSVYDWTREQPREEYARLIAMVERNEFKRRLAALGFKFHRVAYGSGRMVPVVKR